MAFDWGALANGVNGLVGSALGFVGNMYATDKTNATNKAVAEQNIQMQRSTNALNEKLMREAWARDDTSRQRMVTDLENAGLSKWLAAGASPMTSSPISLESPHNDYKANYGGYADAFNHLYSNYLQFEQTRKQNEILDKQGEIASEDLAIKEAEKRIKQHDASVLTNRQDVASTDPATLKYISEAVNLIKGQNETGKDLRGKIQAGIDKAGKVLSKNTTKSNGEKKNFDLYTFMKNKMSKPYKEVKPLTMSEWMALNEYKTMDYQKVKQYDTYVKNFNSGKRR